MKTVFILLDSLNRHFLNIYQSQDPAITPNIDMLASKGTVFDNHWVGSAPCMPARRDIMTGRLNFLEKPWGGMEPFDVSLPTLLKQKNVYSHIVTDHYHYLSLGGENYLNAFCSYDIVRGQEHDTVHMTAGKEGIMHPSRPEGYKGTYDYAHDMTYSAYKDASEYPTPVTLTRAADWLKRNKDADNFLLWVECFDPHEPYDVPGEYLELYEAPGSYTGKPVYWPNYRENIFTPKETRHLRNLYKAQLTMTDQYLGKIFNVLNENSMWEDTAVILTTDHGFMLGEHGFMAKNYMPAYNEVFHIPLVVWCPGVSVKRVSGITQNIDMYPTLAEMFGADISQVSYPIHGLSFLPALKGENDRTHKDIIYGYYGTSVNYYDGQYTYMRCPCHATNRPLYVYTAMPTTARRVYGPGTIDTADYEKIETTHNYAGYPVLKIPMDIVHIDTGSMRYDTRSAYSSRNLLYDLLADYEQNFPLNDDQTERHCIDGLIRKMEECQAPAEQYIRLGLK